VRPGRTFSYWREFDLCSKAPVIRTRSHRVFEKRCDKPSRDRKGALSAPEPDRFLTPTYVGTALIGRGGAPAGTVHRLEAGATPKMAGATPKTAGATPKTAGTPMYIGGRYVPPAGSQYCPARGLPERGL